MKSLLCLPVEAHLLLELRHLDLAEHKIVRTRSKNFARGSLRITLSGILAMGEISLKVFLLVDNRSCSSSMKIFKIVTNQEYTGFVTTKYIWKIYLDFFKVYITKKKIIPQQYQMMRWRNQISVRCLIFSQLLYFSLLILSNSLLSFYEYLERV